MTGLTFDTSALMALERRKLRMRQVVEHARERDQGRLAQIGGGAMGMVPGATLVDALVVASAASRGDIVYSSDVHDLERIRRVFPSVRILGT